MRDQLERLIDESNVFNIEPNKVHPQITGSPDISQYKLIIQDGAKEQSLLMNDMTVPPSLRPLLVFLQKIAIKDKMRNR